MTTTGVTSFCMVLANSTCPLPQDDSLLKKKSSIIPISKSYQDKWSSVVYLLISLRTSFYQSTATSVG